MNKLQNSKNEQEDRMNFVTYWVDFVRTHTDQEWGAQHTKFINSLMQGAKNYPFSATKYLEMKKEKCSRISYCP